MSRQISTARTINKSSDQTVAVDWLGVGLFLVHAAIVGYVVSGWLVESRTGLLIYLLALPLIVLQWVLNGGSSIVSNIESLQRTGHWRDPNSGLDGAFLRSVLKSVGTEATTGQVNTVTVSIMFLFWIEALSRLMLLVSPQ